MSGCVRTRTVAFWEQKAMSDSPPDRLESDEQDRKRAQSESNRTGTLADSIESTTLVVEGVSPDEITVDVLVAVEEAMESYDLDVRGLSIRRET